MRSDFLDRRQELAAVNRRWSSAFDLGNVGDQPLLALRPEPGRNCECVGGGMGKEWDGFERDFQEVDDASGCRA
jgi:hypothetical protein